MAPPAAVIQASLTITGLSWTVKGGAPASPYPGNEGAGAPVDKVGGGSYLRTARQHAARLGDSLTVELSALDRAIQVRILVPQPTFSIA